VSGDLVFLSNLDANINFVLFGRCFRKLLVSQLPNFDEGVCDQARFAWISWEPWKSYEVRGLGEGTGVGVGIGLGVGLLEKGR